MKNFSLDYLKISLIPGTFNYRIDGNFNQTPAASPPVVTGSYDGANSDCLIGVSAYSPGVDVNFNLPGIDFRTYGRRDYLTLLLDEGVPGIQEELAGIVVVDTDYPPPYKPNSKALPAIVGNKDFSEDIKIKELEFIREAVPNNHLFSLKFKAESISGVGYFVQEVVLVSDPRMPVMKALVIKINLPAIPEPEIIYPRVGATSILIQMDLFADRGLPVIFIDEREGIDLNEPNDWTEHIDTKKGLFFIY